MQKIFTLLMFLCGTLALSAQITITVGGTVTDTNGDPVEGVAIYVSTDSIGSSFYSNILYTDVNGQYGDSFTVEDNLTQGIVFFNMTNCQGFYENATSSWYPGNTDLVVDFTYCDPAVICTASIDMDAFGLQLTANGSGTAPYTYLWSTGETTASISPLAPSTYCVTVTNADGCEAVACQYVDWQVDTTCYVYLSLEGTNPAGGFIIEANGSGNAPYSYVWNTGETTAQITVTQSGLYCVTMTDATGCTAVTCEQVNVTDCDADIEITAAGGLGALGTGVAPFTYEWDTGETSSIIYPTENGLYCVTITDSEGCEASACKYYGSIVDTVCSVNIFEVQGGTMLEAQAEGVAPFTYSWSTGETTSFIMVNSSGSYCVTITDAQGCTSSDCHYFATNDNFELNGWVTLADSTSPANLDGLVYLIEYDEQAGTLTAVDTTDFQSTALGWAYFDFGTVPAGDYLVKAALNPGSDGYDDNLPTYYGNVLWWDEATTITMPTPWYGGYEINLVAGVNPGGPGFIGGLVSDGANLQSGEIEDRSGDPMEGVSIIVLNEFESPVAYDYTDENGYYEFPSLDWGTYKVVIEVMGHEQQHYWVTLSPENPSATGLNFEVSEEGITISDVSIVSLSEQVQLFPNPATERLILQIESAEAGEVQLMITDITGKVLEVQAQDIQLGTQQVELDVASYPAGMYLLNLQSGDQIIGKRFIKQ